MLKKTLEMFGPWHLCILRSWPFFNAAAQSAMGRFRKLLVLSLSLLSLSLVSCILLKANPNCQMVSGIRVAHSKTQHLSIFRSLMLTCRSEPKSTKELLALKRVSL